MSAELNTCILSHVAVLIIMRITESNDNNELQWTGNVLCKESQTGTLYMYNECATVIMKSASENVTSW